MARQETPPFPLGSTYFGGDSTLVSTSVGAELEGLEYMFEDNDETQQGGAGAQGKLSGAYRWGRIVRNASGGTLTTPAKLTAKMKSDGTVAQRLGQISGLSGAREPGYPIDEFLTGDVISNDLFWIIVEGRAKGKTAASGDTNFAADKLLICSGSGLLVELDTTDTGANLVADLANYIGRAAEAVNGASTDVNILVHRQD